MSLKNLDHHSEKKTLEYKNLTVRVTREGDVKSLIRILMSYLQLRNLIMILIKKNRGENLAQPDKRPNLFSELTNPGLMRALLWGQKGGKNQEKVSFLRDFYETDALMKEAIHLGMTLKDKIITELVKQIQQNYRSFFAIKEMGAQMAREPKATPLRLVLNYSLPIDMETVSLKRKNKIRFLLERGKPFELHVNHDEILKSIGDFKRIKRMEICLKNGSVYLLFSYEVDSPKPSPIIEDSVSSPPPEKIAGLDLGVVRLASLFIFDQSSPSLLVDGKEFSSFNAEYNRKRAKIWERLAPLKNSMKAIEKAEREKAVLEGRLEYVPLAWIRETREDYRKLSTQAFVLEKRLKKLSWRRRHFFDSNFKKLAKRLVTYLAERGVSHIVTSRNILGCKGEGPSLGRIQNQRFFSIPFDRFLSAIKNAAQKVGIKVKDDLDEAYSSKTSSLSGDIGRAQEVLKDELRENTAVRSDVFKGKRVKRGLYEDTPTKRLLHADINAAANLVKLELNRIGQTELWKPEKIPLWKFSNPRNLIQHALLSHLDRVVFPPDLCPKEKLASAFGGLRFEVAS